MVFYDFPMKTKKEKQSYSKFRRNLIKNGFLMMQYSVYYKHMDDLSFSKYTIDRINAFAPSKATVNYAKFTINQFRSISILSKNKINIKNDISNIVEY